MVISLVIILGLVIGSFLNVCIYRIPRELSVVSPARSYCPNCKYQLSAFDNIPVLSWIFLGGKCRNCKQSISGQYPLVEILSAIAAFECLVKFGLNPTSVLIYFFTLSLIVITFIDLEFKIIPDVISYPGMIIGLTIGGTNQYFHFFSDPVSQSAQESLIGMFVGGGFFYIISWGYYLSTKEIGLGGGDIKLMGMVGTIFGWKIIADTIFLGSLFGAVIGIGVMIFAGGGRKSEIPFGPWLSLGAIIYIFTNWHFFNF